MVRWQMHFVMHERQMKLKHYSQPIWRKQLAYEIPLCENQ